MRRLRSELSGVDTWPGGRVVVVHDIIGEVGGCRRGSDMTAFDGIGVVRRIDRSGRKGIGLRVVEHDG